MDIDKREELFNKYIRTKNGKHFKLTNTFSDLDLSSTVLSMIDGSFETTNKSINSKKKVFNGGKKDEIIYKQFSSLCALIYSLVESSIGVDDDFLLSRLNCFLEKTYFDVEECEKSERVQRFRQANTGRVEVTNPDLYKTLMCEKGASVDAKFQEFEKYINEITGKDKKIHIIKSPLSPIEYIMRLGIILKDPTKKSCSFYYSLDNKDNGISWHLENEEGLLYTEEKVIDYLDTCIDICKFLKNSTDYNGRTEYGRDYYMLTEGRNSSWLWLYNILPSYIISKIENDEKREYAFNIVLISYLVYSINYYNSPSVQYIQPYMYDISKLILERMFDNFSVEDFKCGLKNKYIDQFGKFIKDGLTATVKQLRYGVPKSKGGLLGIFSTLEYYAQKEAGIKKDNLHKLLTVKDNKKNAENSVQLDHIYPKINKNERNELVIDSVGNLVLLEATLNESKGDDQNKTVDAYSGSSFLTTKVIIKENKYEFLTADTLNRVRNNALPYSTTAENMCHYSIDDAEERRDKIADKIRTIAKMDWC